jgi:hypothetical protein
MMVAELVLEVITVVTYILSLFEKRHEKKVKKHRAEGRPENGGEGWESRNVADMVADVTDNDEAIANFGSG